MGSGTDVSPSPDEMDQLDRVALGELVSPSCGRRTISRFSSTTTVRGSSPRWRSRSRASPEPGTRRGSPFTMMSSSVMPSSSPGRQQGQRGGRGIARLPQGRDGRHAVGAGGPQLQARSGVTPPMAITGRPSAAASRTSARPTPGRPGCDALSYTFPTTRIVGALLDRRLGLREAVHRAPDPARRKDSPGVGQREMSPAPSWTPCAPIAAARSGRPLTKTAASGGRASASSRSATAASSPPRASRSRACSATAGPAAAIAAARMPKSGAA